MKIQHLPPLKLREPVTMNLRTPADVARLVAAAVELDRTPARKDFDLRARIVRMRTREVL